MISSISFSTAGAGQKSKTNSPVVVLLHGYGANEQDLPEIMQSLPGSLAWVSPRAPLVLQPGSYAWAPITVPGNPNPIEAAVATDQLWKWIDENVSSESQIIPIGFSQGGMMATQLLRTRPERILGTVILAGFNVDSNQPADENLKTELPQVIYCYGLDDQVVSAAAVERLTNWLESHTTATVISYRRLGHSVDERVLDDVSKFFTKTLGIR
jgi:phospholipase/carboxylesterase